jgi:hypothetical protein
MRDACGPKDWKTFLISMPWQALSTPSIQLGILQSVLEEANVCTQVANLGLAFMDFCCTETAAFHEESRIGLAEYEAILNLTDTGLGDWIFAVPPFRDGPVADAAYVQFLRSRTFRTDFYKRC